MEHKFCAFLGACEDVALAGNKPITIFDDAPVQIDILALAGLPVSRIWMSGCVHITSVAVD